MERPFRILISISGGENAASALGVLPGLAAPEHEVVFLHVRAPGDCPEPTPTQQIREAVEGLPRLDAIELVAEDAGAAIVDVSSSVDLVVLGATDTHEPLGAGVLDLVRRNRCPTIVVRREREPRHVDRGGPRALVVAESSHEGVLGLERALRWAKAGSVAQDVLFVPARGEVRGPTGRLLGPAAILSEVRSEPRDLVVIACDPSSDATWASEVAAGVGCCVVFVFASASGPRTRRRALPVAASVG